MKLKNLLGKCSWSAKTGRGSRVSLSGVDPCWYSFHATLEELVAALPQNEIEEYTYFVCEQWQKVGRSIKKVPIKEYER